MYSRCRRHVANTQSKSDTIWRCVSFQDCAKNKKAGLELFRTEHFLEQTELRTKAFSANFFWARRINGANKSCAAATPSQWRTEWRALHRYNVALKHWRQSNASFYKYSFWPRYISQHKSHKQCIAMFSIKNLTARAESNPYLLFLRRMWWPLRHATLALLKNKLTQYRSIDAIYKYWRNIQVLAQYTSIDAIYKYWRNIQVLTQYTSIDAIYKYWRLTIYSDAVNDAFVMIHFERRICSIYHRRPISLRDALQSTMLPKASMEAIFSLIMFKALNKSVETRFF
jgi:hypothetical protein